MEHVVLTRNEFGAGYYHIMFDTLASLAWVLPKLRDDPSATFLLNPCNLGREQDANAQGQGGGKRGVAPGFGHACNARRYAMELLEALGVAQSRVMPKTWCYATALAVHTATCRASNCCGTRDVHVCTSFSSQISA